MKVAKQQMNMLLIFRKITLLAVYCMDWRETGGREMRKENLQGSVGSVMTLQESCSGMVRRGS